jgi:hypothetical protein
VYMLGYNLIRPLAAARIPPPVATSKSPTPLR